MSQKELNQQSVKDVTNGNIAKMIKESSTPKNEMPKYIADFLEWLTGFVNYEAALNKYTSDDHIFSLAPIRDLTKRLDFPEKSAKVVHVAGSKGKGSVSKMIACILDEMVGEPVSIYASPHVYDFRERVCHTQGFFDDEVYQKSIKELKTVVSRDNLTNVSWHELTTEFGFLCAKHSGAKYSVIEVGCGGRLDATNIVTPEISVINHIELEHTALLGNTLEKIAAEKAGIIKNGVPVVIARQSNESVKNVFRKKAKEQNAPIYFVDEECEIQNLRYQDSRMFLEITGPKFQQPLNLRLKMLGEKQAENAALAALALKILNPEISAEQIEQGLEKASLPGRFEQRGNIILDGAHTPSSVAQALSTLESLYPGENYNLLFASVAGKDLEHIVPLFRHKFKRIYLTVPGSTKDPDLGDITKVFRENNLDFIADEDYTEIIRQALENTSKNEKLLVIGSFYLLEKVAKNSSFVIK